MKKLLLGKNAGKRKRAAPGHPHPILASSVKTLPLSTGTTDGILSPLIAHAHHPTVIPTTPSGPDLIPMILKRTVPANLPHLLRVSLVAGS